MKHQMGAPYEGLAHPDHRVKKIIPEKKYPIYIILIPIIFDTIFIGIIMPLIPFQLDQYFFPKKSLLFKGK